MTVARAQRLADSRGGARERRAPVAWVGFHDGEASNVLSAYAEDGSHLFDLGYRPHEAGSGGVADDGLFLC